MNPFYQIKFFLHITGSDGIVRRYFVVNGFDGALTMLGLIMGFLVSENSNLDIMINACLGAAIALGVSGVSSAYVSEQAEHRRALAKLEESMITDLQSGAHSEAARWVPIFVAIVNGFAPLLISLFIILPLLIANNGITFYIDPLYAAILIALILIFLLGIFLGRISEVYWLRSGIQTLLIALLTMLLIYLFSEYEHI